MLVLKVRKERSCPGEYIPDATLAALSTAGAWGHFDVCGCCGLFGKVGSCLEEFGGWKRSIVCVDEEGKGLCRKDRALSLCTCLSSRQPCRGPIALNSTIADWWRQGR
jgi:hypothetical protein